MRKRTEVPPKPSQLTAVVQKLTRSRDRVTVEQASLPGLGAALKSERPTGSIDDPDFYLGPISPWTRGPISALESERVNRGLSIAIGGATLGDGVEHVCPKCCRYSGGYLGTPLFRPFARVGDEVMRVEGPSFKCGQCGATFVAHAPVGVKPEYHGRGNW